MAKPDKPYRHRTIGEHVLRPETLMMSYGYEPRLSEGSVKCPLFQTSTFVFERAEAGKAFFEVAYGLREMRPAEEPGLIYSRINNPDLEILEDRLGLWDGAESSLVFSSGMAAISTTLWTFLRPGDVLVHSEPLYGGTEFLVHNDPAAVRHPARGVRRRRRRPLARGGGRGGQGARAGRRALCRDAGQSDQRSGRHRALRRARGRSCRRPQSHRPPVIVDNTFLGPLWQQPLSLGADLVIYSLTKYVGGHSDVIAGASLGSEALISAVRGMRTILGTMSDPHTGWLLMRSLETLKLRMTGAMKNARYVAEFLADHPRSTRCTISASSQDGHPDARDLPAPVQGAGLDLLVRSHGGEAEAFRLLDRLQLIRLAVSFGGTERLAEHPGTMTHSDIPPERRRELGITPAMIRLSVGVEHPEDLIADLEQALEAV